MKNVLGIDIGGTKIAVCLANEKGEILGSERFPSTKTCEEAVDRIASLANDLLEMKEMTMADVACCGISAPGPEPGMGGQEPDCILSRGKARSPRHS